MLRFCFTYKSYGEKILTLILGSREKTDSNNFHEIFGPRSAPAEMRSEGIDGAGTGNDSRVPDADHRDSRGRQGRSLLGLTT